MFTLLLLLTAFVTPAVVADATHQFDELCSMPVANWGLGDDQGLAQQSMLALASDTEMLAKAREIRARVHAEWEQWNSEEVTVKKEELFLKLQDKVRKSVEQTWGGKGTYAADLVEMILSYDFFAPEFVQTMLARLRGSDSIEAVTHLYFLAMGYAFTSKYHTAEKRSIAFEHKRQVTDKQCARECMALLFCTYRHLYDSFFLSARDGFEVDFMSECTRLNKDEAGLSYAKKAKEQWFLGEEMASEKSDSVVVSEWKKVEEQAREAAHRSAESKLKDMLNEVFEVMVSVHARLQVLHVSDARFDFPAAAQSSQEHLSNREALSILIGCMRRAFYEVLEKKHAAVSLDTVQHLFVSEMASQLDAKHIRATIPAGGEKKKSFSVATNIAKDFEAAKRMAYEVRMYTIASPRIDFIRGEGEMEDVGGIFKHINLSVALSGLATSDGMKLYRLLVREYGYFNAVSWGLIKKPKSFMVERMKKIAAKVKAYCERIGIADFSSNGIKKAFASCIKNAALWKGATEVSFKTPRSLRKVLSDFKKDDAMQTQVYKNLYTFLWVCIAMRFSVFVASGGSEEEESVTGQSDESVYTLADESEKKAAESSKGMAATLREKAAEAPAALQENAHQLMRKFELLKQEAATKFAEKGDVVGVFDQLNSMLSGLGEFVPQLTTAMDAVYTETQKQSERMMVTMKASLVYMHAVGEFVNKKIATVQEALEALGRSKKVRAAGWAVSKLAGPSIKKMAEEVSETDKALLNKIQMALSDVKAALQGRRGVEEITSVSNLESTHRDRVRENATHTRQGRLETLSKQYDLAKDSEVATETSTGNVIDAYDIGGGA